MKNNWYEGKKVLVACSRLVDYAGAEIATLEIAWALRELGCDVLIGALEVGGALENELIASEIPYVDLSAVSLQGAHFELVWISHYLVAYHLFAHERISANYGIYASLSHFEPLETPPLPNIVFSQYLVHSNENYNFFSANYPYFVDRVTIFPNAAPSEYINAIERPVKDRISTIAVVSNHVPNEVLEAIKELYEQHGIVVDIIGAQGTAKRVTAELIGNYDAIMAIGKTVQYCLAAGVPIYCYDHFGGPGWINQSNVDLAFSMNFSGRCTPVHKTVAELCSDLITDFETLNRESSVMREMAFERFSLIENTSKLLSAIFELPMAVSLSETELKILSRESLAFTRQRGVIANCHQVIMDQNSKIAIISQELEQKKMIVSNSAHESEDPAPQSERQTDQLTDNTIKGISEGDSEAKKSCRQLESFNMTRAEWEAEIKKINENLVRQEEIILHIDQEIMSRDSSVAVFSSTLAEREGVIAELSQQLSNKTLEIANASTSSEAIIRSLNAKIHEVELHLAQTTFELKHIKASTAWRVTAPARYVLGKHGLKIAYMKILMANAIFVLKRDGLAAFLRRSKSFMVRRAERKRAASNIDRYVEVPTYQPLDAPIATIVIPVYDRTDVLRVAINSALAQTLTAFEVIIVTDGSPPATMAVVNEFKSHPKVRIFSYPTSSGNAVRGRNKGILEARGRYVAFLDSDDIAAPDRLEVSIPVLEGGADVVYGGWRALLDGSRVIDGLANGQEVYSPDCDLALLEKACVPCQSTVMVKREMLLISGFLKGRMEYREDHELWLRLAYHGAIFKSIPYVLADLRLHAGNNELNFKDKDAHWEALLREEYKKKGPRPKKIGFLFGGLGISGGAAVALKHISTFLEMGHDAFVIDIGGYGDIGWFGNPAIRTYRLDDLKDCGIDNLDMLFATFWTTVEWLEKIPAKRKLYLVQSDERLFYDDPLVKEQVAATYRKDIEYIGIAGWIIEFLSREFHQKAMYLPNGIDTELFYPDTPLEEKNPQRLRVLLEGPISVPFKGVSESYEAVKGLDCELWIVSSDGVPDPDWKYDRFFQKVHQSEMRQIYSSCDILLKMSKIESFAYPPLEAMACGCAVVIMDVSGGIEYAVNEENVLKVGVGDIAAARACVQRLLTDAELRKKLKEAGFSTVTNWTWEPAKAVLSAMTDC